MSQAENRKLRRPKKVQPGDERESTSIYMKASLRDQAKEYAYEDGRSFGGLIEKALVAYMANHPLNQPEPVAAN